MNHGTERNRERYEALTPEQRARVDAIRAERNTPEGRARRAEALKAIEEEVAASGGLTTADGTFHPVKRRPNSGSTIMTYHGYIGAFQVDLHAHVIRGHVLGLQDTITFQGATVAEAILEFRNSVDAYLEFCRSLGEEPEPSSG
jgi:hypothetical protein